MILILGGTTEGRRAAEVLEEAGKPFYYSTKTGEQDIMLHHGRRTDGAMDADGMRRFCQEHGIRLLVDAAHPFAQQLHQTVMATGSELQLPVIRYERIYPPRDPSITWIDNYSEVPRDIRSLLATTGVQSISRLKALEAQGIKVYYRILPRESSIRLAHQQGATDSQLCYYEDGSAIDVDADAILLKESGISGGFIEKVNAAKARGMRIIALKRPQLSMQRHTLEERTVNGPHGLRRMVERLLPDFFDLHSGLTTGTCATAAAIAATLRLVRNETTREVPVVLPNGETITVTVGYGDTYAYCIKEAGDDPDVTNGIEIRAEVRVESLELREGGIVIEGGKGVGRFTLPGFDYPPGAPAINRGPRQMIKENISPLLSTLNSKLSTLNSQLSTKVTISVPNGEETARRTFNPRLGIEGGISIIGVSGIVKPFSEEAFLDSIRKCMQVAKASGSQRVVINSGAKSERFVRAVYPDLPQQAFVQYGNYIGETLRMAHGLDIRHVTLCIMLGKAVKLAAGHLDTHSKKTTFDLGFIRQLLAEAGIRADISGITLARELWERIPADGLQAFANILIRHCMEHCQPLLPGGELTILLIDDNGKIYRPVH